MFSLNLTISLTRSPVIAGLVNKFEGALGGGGVFCGAWVVVAWVVAGVGVGVGVGVTEGVMLSLYI
jgi:hypothetical protein